MSSGGYLHTSRNIKFNDKKGKIESINGKSFNPEQIILTAMPAQFFGGLDNQKPLLDWAANVGHRPSFDEEATIPAKMIREIPS